MGLTMPNLSNLKLRLEGYFNAAPRAVRLLMLGGSYPGLILGMALLLPLPELGIPLVLLCLFILSLRHRWAKRTLESLEIFIAGKPIKAITAIAGLAAAVVIVFIWLL